MKSHKQLITLNFAALMALALVFGSSCTRKRDPKMTEAADSKIFAIDEFGDGNPNSAPASFRLGTSPFEICKTPGLSASCEQPSFNISPESLMAPSKMSYMFEGLFVTGKSGQDFKVVFSVDDQYLQAYKVANNTQEKASYIEQGTGITIPQLNLMRSVQAGTYTKGEPKKDFSVAEKSKQGQALLIPLFKYKIKAKGILERKKNPNGEETSEIVLTPTDFKNAQYIQLDSGTEARVSAPYFDAGSEAQLDSLMVAEKLHNKTFNSNELNAALGIDAGAITPQQECPQAVISSFVTRVDKATSTLKLFGVVYGCGPIGTTASTAGATTTSGSTTGVDSSAISAVAPVAAPTETKPEVKVQHSSTLLPCPDQTSDEQTTLSAPMTKEKCQLVDLNQNMRITFVHAELPLQRNGKRADNITFTATGLEPSGEVQGLIKLEPKK